MAAFTAVDFPAPTSKEKTIVVISLGLKVLLLVEVNSLRLTLYSFVVVEIGRL